MDCNGNSNRCYVRFRNTNAATGAVTKIVKLRNSFAANLLQLIVNSHWISRDTVVKDISAHQLGECINFRAGIEKFDAICLSNSPLSRARSEIAASVVNWHARLLLEVQKPVFCEVSDQFSDFAEQ